MVRDGILTAGVRLKEGKKDAWRTLATSVQGRGSRLLNPFMDVVIPCQDRPKFRVILTPHRRNATVGGMQ